MLEDTTEDERRKPNKKKSKRPRSHPPPSSAPLFQMNYHNNNNNNAIPPPPPIPSDSVPGGFDPWQLPSLAHHHQQQPSSISRSSSRRSAVMPLKPKASFTRLQSLDSLITYREEKAEWKRASSFIQAAWSGEEELQQEEQEQQQQHEYDDDTRREPTTTREPTVRGCCYGVDDSVAGAHAATATATATAAAAADEDGRNQQQHQQHKDLLLTFADEKSSSSSSASSSSSSTTSSSSPSSSVPNTPRGEFSKHDKKQEQQQQQRGDDTTLPHTRPSFPSSSTKGGGKEEGEYQPPKNKFRTFAAEVGFCFTIAMTQFLAEYMISGFAIELPKIMNRYTSSSSSSSSGGGMAAPGSLGMFWPASLLSLILSATLLTFARISDMYGGYLPFMFGVVWLGIWSLLAGFSQTSVLLLDVSRAMQGLAIAAYIPSTFAMMGSIYPEGPRKNLVLGLYSGCAPLGFFAGFLAAGALPDEVPGWYFWIAAILAFVTAVTAYLTVPHDRTDRQQLGLKMDWIGAFLITAGLILVAYGLAVEPYANQFDTARSGWTFPMVLGPLITGLACLGIAFWVEGWYAACPLLPFDFFSPRSVKAFSLACLCFYASYGVWLYESASYFSSASATGTAHGITGLKLAAWYTPTAVGGLILCVVGGALLHLVPILMLLVISGLAWIGAPLLLALAPLPLHYWSFVMPSMLCATIGIDLTFTISVVYLSSVSPLRYQGLAGAVSSILVNLAMSFSLSISEIVAVKAESAIPIPHSASPAERLILADQRANRGYKYAFIYAAASAGLGLFIAALFVRISRSVVQEKKAVDLEGGPRHSSEVSTLVDVPRSC